MTNAQPTQGGGAAWLFAGHYGVIIVVFVAMVAATWLTWPDPTVDFGRELYVPWQITQGKVLYRDIAYFNGPLSPYFNALMFRIFGLSLRTLMFANLALLAGLTWMIWRVIRLISDEFTATTACVVLLTAFSFLQLGNVRNYNFVTPYSHEIAHGVILSFLGLICLMRFIDRRRAWIAGVTGIVLGLVFLTKVEVFLAAAVAISAGILLARPSAKAIGLFFLCILVPPLLALILLWTKLPFGQAFRGMMGSWMYVFDNRITNLAFYRNVMGTDDVHAGLRTIAEVAGVYGVILLLSILAGMVLPRRWNAVYTVLIGGIVAVVIAFLVVPISTWQRSLRGMTLVAPLLALGTTALAIRRPRPRRIVRAAFSIFATLLMAKIALNVVPYHYGFALAMPATLLAVVGAVYWLPDFLERRGGFEWSARAVVLPVIALFVFVLLFVYLRDFYPQREIVGSGSDRFYSDIRGKAVQRMLELTQPHPSGQTVAVLPDGAMFNYLSRTPNPTPYITLMPPEVLMFGQETILGALEAHPPDVIIFNTRSDPKEYGYDSFAAYAPALSEWINQNYQEQDLRQAGGFPFRLLRRR